MDGELGLLHLDPDVSEGVLSAEDIEAREDHVGVCGALKHKLLRVPRDLGPSLDLCLLPVLGGRGSEHPYMSCNFPNYISILKTFESNTWCRPRVTRARMSVMTRSSGHCLTLLRPSVVVA